MAVKTVKLVTGAIPVVGSIVGDAAETVVAGLRTVRSVAGIFGVLGVAAIAIVPVAATALRCAVFRAAAIFTRLAGGDALAGVIEGLSKVFALILALVGSCALLMVVSVYMLITGSLPL